MRSHNRIAVFFSLALFLFAVAAVSLPAQSHQPIVINNVHHDVSPPLSQLAGSGPVPPQPREARDVRPTQPLPGSDLPFGQDQALQQLQLPMVSTTAGLNFAGVGANGYIPPDTNGSAGATQYVQITNVQYAVFDKTSGAALLGPSLINTIWSGFTGTCSKL